MTGALAAGAYLQEVHGREEESGWGNWVKGHCPQLPISTAYRYMDLARKFPRVRKLEEIRNLRQAYIALEILPETPAKAEAKQAPALHHVEPATGTDLVARVKSTWAFLGVEFENADFVAMEDATSATAAGNFRVARWVNRDHGPAHPGQFSKSGNRQRYSGWKGVAMSIATPIQWTDDTVNPVMGCSAPCELRPSPAKVEETTLNFFREAFSDFDRVQVAWWMDSIIRGRNATKIYQLRDRTVDAVVLGAGAPQAKVINLRKAYKAAPDEIFICYAHQQTMMRGSDITSPDKRTNPGFPVQFEILKKFPGRMAEAAVRPDLYGMVRPGKPWLDYLPRIFFVSDMADALSEEIDFDYLKAEIIDVV